MYSGLIYGPGGLCGLVWFSVCGTVPSDAITEDMLLTSLSLGSWGGWSQALLICGGGPVLCTSFF